MVSIKQSLRAVSVIALVLMTVFITALFALYNANLSLARAAAEALADNKDLLAQLAGKASMGNMIFVMSGLSMGLTSGVALVMYISRHIAENQASMGILKAMGYHNGQIARRYALFGLPVLLGSVPGFIAAFLLEPGFGALINANVDMPDIQRGFPLPILALSVAALPLLFMAVAVATARVKLRRPPLAMIRESVSLRAGLLARRYSRRKSERPFLKELSSAVVRGNLVLLFFVAFAGLAFGNQLQLGFAVSSMTDKVLERSLEGMGYQSNVRFHEAQDIERNERQLPYAAVRGGLSVGGDDLARGELVVFQSGGNVFRLLDADTKTEIDLNTLDGVVVNDWMRRRYDLSPGDAVTFKRDGETLALPIAAFERSAFGETVYCGFETAEKYAILEHNGCNGVYTADAVTFDAQRHRFVITAQDIRDEFQAQKETYRSLSAMFFVLGTLIGLVTLQIALRVAVNANRKYIAMLKAYGYSGAERRRAILGKYRPVAYIGFLIGTGYAYGILTVLFGMTAKTSDMAVPVTADIWALLAAPVLFIIAYELMIAAYSRKIGGVSLKELMNE